MILNSKQTWHATSLLLIDTQLLMQGHLLMQKHRIRCPCMPDYTPGAIAGLD